MTWHELLETARSVVEIAAPPIAAVWGLLIYRSRSIQANRQDLGRSWTNEGAIDYLPPHYITLHLQLLDNDLVGTLRSNTAFHTSLEAHVEAGWFWSLLRVTQLRGRSLVAVANVRLRLVGNRNRLKWKLLDAGADGRKILPDSEVLWPIPSQPIKFPK